ncbi:hypothetical protein M409DRAFT_19051 [Zasmidium cellare ATCC 36951]|uniref:Imidazoleglycerol-phosphate dehydratase n=1 Tax=Zasmidium cellare ATCC 36951 TaxID=1080233 RepID=A0A6A6CY21_ZASCE|nr:uncharacterized protein M409DRAFT_19051 [Zasmidium cellare ATCC 36951]KAF2171080.1 hypothetical protein M409DRAFT_19051 [Zasmidium cellare ATCC 36951]
MVRKHGSLTKDEEINEASWVAARGAAVGACKVRIYDVKWGLFSAVAAGVAFTFSPLYRGLTIQMKVFLQMSGMTFGSIVEADRRLIQHEKLMRNRKKIARDAEVWRMYEEDYERQTGETAPTQQQPQQQDNLSSKET